MSTARRRQLGVVFLSLSGALFLTIFSIPPALEDFRPQWVALTLLFWVLYLPDLIGIFWAFSCGVILDAISGVVLGQNALSLSIIVYITIILRPRLRAFPLWQQSVSVWILLLAERLITLWILGATGQPIPTLSYWLPTFCGLGLWPLLTLLAARLEFFLQEK